MPLQPAWAQPRNVALLIAGYLLVHWACACGWGRRSGLDDAEQALFAQHWLLNYRFRAPPLFTWALVAAGEVIGTGMLAISLIRYALLAMLFGFTYLTARRLIRDDEAGGARDLQFHGHLRVRLLQPSRPHAHDRPVGVSRGELVRVRSSLRDADTRWYLALGLCFGLGMLGKWNFIMFALALPLACLALCPPIAAWS